MPLTPKESVCGTVNCSFPDAPRSPQKRCLGELVCMRVQVCAYVCICVSVRLELSTGKVLFIYELQVYGKVPGMW